MTPSHARRRGIKYRYYISSALLQGRSKEAGIIIGSRHRRSRHSSSKRCEIASMHRPRSRTQSSSRITSPASRCNRTNSPLNSPMQSMSDRSGSGRAATQSMCRGARHHPPGAGRFLCLNPKHLRTSVLSVPRTAHFWSHRLRGGADGSNELINDPAANTESIIDREGCTARKVNMTISLVFLAPDLVKATIDGRLPHGMGVVRLSDMPAEWPRQRQTLGLSAAQLPHSNRVSA